MVEITVQAARDPPSAYLVAGRPRHRNALRRLVHRQLVLKLMRVLPGVQVQIAALPDFP